MAFDENLAKRIRQLLKSQEALTEKKMFGGLAFMLGGKMCCGVLNDDLVARVGAESYEKALKAPHVRPMDFTGRPMKGYVYVGKAATRSDRGLKVWLGQCVVFTSSLSERKMRRYRQH
jgi:TfoX/Sxy family transcriptional regulator of competence genes